MFAKKWSWTLWEGKFGIFGPFWGRFDCLANLQAWIKGWSRAKAGGGRGVLISGLFFKKSAMFNEIRVWQFVVEPISPHIWLFCQH